MNKIEYTKNPSTSDIDFLTKQINQETSEYGEAYPFAFFMRDDDSKTIAGANGFILYGKIYTDQLWVDKQYRKQGIARKLMSKVHELGKEKNCTMATISTMSFQNAVQFYEKLGYQKDFERFGHIQNSSCIFMRKAL